MNRTLIFALYGAIASAVFSTSATSSQAATAIGSRVMTSKDLLIKFESRTQARRYLETQKRNGSSTETRAESLGGDERWIHVQFPASFTASDVVQLASRKDVVAIEPNGRISMIEDYRLKDPAERARLARWVETRSLFAPPDNPAFPTQPVGGAGSDPDFAQQWGMADVGVKNAWTRGRGKNVVVAVIDTGVDYTHEDLADNMWRNPGEMGIDEQGRDKSTNDIDDDGNGLRDDVMGWDFASNDNKPYDLSVDPLQVLMGGGNPGHGTHCAGNVAAVANNGKGVVGVAPEAKILPIRFLNEKGKGDVANAVKAVNYAVRMGARVLSNSWGSEGVEAGEEATTLALKDAIANAERAGVLFVAAAGNGHQGIGYDNDTDPKPAYPASFDFENIVSVAALDSTGKLGSFSNWGAKTVDIGAPGVKVFATTVGGKYSDTVVDMYGIKATWDGTSMACPHVAGAAAAYLSKHPQAGYREIKQALLRSAKPLPALSGKSVSGGKLNVEALLEL